MPTTPSATTDASESGSAQQRHRSRLRLLAAGIAGLLAWLAIDRLLVDRRPIVVGLLHSLTGVDAGHEKLLLDAEISTLSALNTAGGLLGRPIRWVIADGASDPQAFARQAARLIRDEGASVLVGCWRTPGRKAVVRVVEANDHLLVYPGVYEGLEQSPNVVYTGAIPNQFLGPAVDWLRRELHAERFFLLGADDLWGRSIEVFAADLLAGLDCQVVGRRTISEDDDIATAVAAIAAARPDAIVSTLEWPATTAVARALRNAGIRPETMPLLALPCGAPALPSQDSLAGVYTLTGPDAAGPAAGASPPTAASAVTGLRLWAQAVRDADTTDVRQVRDAMRHQSISVSDGILAVDPGTQHTWQRLSVGRIRSDGRLENVSTAPGPALRPVPFPATRSRLQWDQLTAALFRRWGGAWGPPLASPAGALLPSAVNERGAPR